MRIYLSISPNTEIIPFDYQQKLVGVLHKWIGQCNDIHGRLSLYSFSWLQNGTMVKDGFNFPNGAIWFISFFDDNIIKDIIRTILRDPGLFSGMFVSDITIKDTPDLGDRRLFYLATQIHIKYKLENGEEKHFTYKDQEASDLMRDTLVHKMSIVNLPPDPMLKVEFDLTYMGKKEKLIRYKGIGNKASMCPIIIEGTAETKAFAWNVGIGNSTGIGFGSLY